MTTHDRRISERRSKHDAPATEQRHADRRVSERRQSLRVPLEIWMEEVYGEDVYFRRTGNIGEGGAYFERAIPHPLGTLITLKFMLPGDKEMVIARGEVVSTSGNVDGLGMRVKFVNIEGNGRQRLRDYIHGL